MKYHGRTTFIEKHINIAISGTQGQIANQAA